MDNEYLSGEGIIWSTIFFICNVVLTIMFIGFFIINVLLYFNPKILA